MTAAYDERFYAWVNRTAQRSARAVLPVVQRQVRPATVLDVGCGQGAWLAVWSELGLSEGNGLDGDYVDTDALLIPRERFHAADLSKHWDLGRRFEMVQSLEVAEHLPAASAETFVLCLCKHADVVLFSAAQPGQGGESHINERRPSYWAGLFAANGYWAVDCIRPLVIGQTQIAPWYRFNTLLFVNASGMSRIADFLLFEPTSELDKLDRGGDALWLLKRALLRPLPEAAVTFLSRLRYRIAVAFHKTFAKR